MHPSHKKALDGLMEMSNKAMRMRVMKAKAPGKPEQMAVEVEKEAPEGMSASAPGITADVPGVEESETKLEMSPEDMQMLLDQLKKMS